LGQVWYELDRKMVLKKFFPEQNGKL